MKMKLTFREAKCLLEKQMQNVTDSETKAALQTAIIVLETIDQITWERDIAIEQLHILGYEFGEEVKDSRLIPKKPEHAGCTDADGVRHEWVGINGSPYELCPNCRKNLCCEGPFDIKPKFCKNCGQALDWTDWKSYEIPLK